MAARPTDPMFAKALFQAALECNRQDTVRGDLAALGELARDVPALASFLRLNTLSSTRRRQALRDLFEGRVDPLTLDALLLLEKHGALDRLPHVAAAVEKMWSESTGRKRAEVEVARPLAPDQIERLRVRLAARLGVEPDHVDIDVRKNVKLLGGFTVEVDGWFLDGSLAGRLSRLRWRSMLPGWGSS